MKTQGEKFREALKRENPLQIVGTINAYAAIMAKKVGFHAIYLSGAGVANSSYGIPDSGLTTLENVLEDAKRITSAVNIPLLVDIDTGWDNVEQTIRKMEQAGVAAVHIEDQISQKKCGHLPGKSLVSTEEMVSRIRSAVRARSDPSFVIMARTDAFANEGMEGAIARAIAYRKAGADMLFPEAFVDLRDYQTIKEAVGIPILANITEFGLTPLYTTEELKKADVDMVLYPLSANRAMNKAALDVFHTIRKEGTQKNCIEKMQTRKELYQFLETMVKQ